MQTKYRSFPPPVPLKISKLLQYEYFSQIYKKYDCNFFREILPYFSQIVTTDKLQTLKFIYVPIQNLSKVKNMQIGIPFQPQIQKRNPNYYQLSKQVTFIKISYQTHIIFEYLMNLNLFNIGIQRLKFQDKFWLFTEGILRNYKFNDLVFKNQTKNNKQQSSGLYFILDGEFKCYNSKKVSYKTIGKGYVIDQNGRLKKINFQQNLIQQNSSKSTTIDGINSRNLADGANLKIVNEFINLKQSRFHNESANKTQPKITKVKRNNSQTPFKVLQANIKNPDTKIKGFVDNKFKLLDKNLFHQHTSSTNNSTTHQKQQIEQQQRLYSLWSNSNNAKILFLDLNIIKKYSSVQQDNCSNYQNCLSNKENCEAKEDKKTSFRNFMKYRRLKTEKEEFKSRKTWNTQIQGNIPSKKFNLISCRLGNMGSNKIILDPIEQIANNQILRSYIKDNQTYQQMKKQKSLNKHKRFFSNAQKQKSNIHKQQKLLSFFRRQLNEQKQKLNLKRRITKQNMVQMTIIQKQNKFRNSFDKTAIKPIQQLNKNNLRNKSDQIQESIQENKRIQMNSEISNKKLKKVHKNQLNAYQLLKRNLFNKQFHKIDFVHMKA